MQSVSSEISIIDHMFFFVFFFLLNDTSYCLHTKLTSDTCISMRTDHKSEKITCIRTEHSSDCYNARCLQFAGRNVLPFEHIILIANNKTIPIA